MAKRRKKINLFYIPKLTTSELVANGYCLKTSFPSLKKEGKIISLADNQILRFVRQVKNITFDPEDIRQLTKERRYYSSQNGKPNFDKMISIQNTINEMLFVEDLVSVRCDDSKGNYKKICRNGFTIEIEINGKTYVTNYKRLCAGAGMLRKNTALFCNENILQELETIMMCGLTRSKIGKINLAKFTAYYALFSSASQIVTTPRICVVKDYEYVLANQDISWIYEDENGNEQIKDEKKDFEVNAFDGSGIICPKMAEKWADDLGLDYLPSSFIVRSAWIKGVVNVFDFHRFSKEIANKNIIIDYWGNEVDADNIDVILSSSQFKMAKKYSSWQEYSYFHSKFHHVFGVARVNKRENRPLTTLNYQYIQTNNFTCETIKGLASYTISWLNKIMNGDRLYGSLVLMGTQDEQDDVEFIENKLNSNIAKILMYEEDILKDPYVRSKISQLIQKKIDQAKIGKIFVEGSYDFMIPDPYAFAEHAFGAEVNGLLGFKECWNKRWVDKGSKQVTCMRSPLVAPAENQKLSIRYDDKCIDWYQYIKSGNIFNIKDLTAISMSDELASRCVVICNRKCSEPVNTGCVFGISNSRKWL